MRCTAATLPSPLLARATDVVPHHPDHTVRTTPQMLLSPHIPHPPSHSSITARGAGGGGGGGLRAGAGQCGLHAGQPHGLRVRASLCSLLSASVFRLQAGLGDGFACCCSHPGARERTYVRTYVRNYLPTYLTTRTPTDTATTTPTSWPCACTSGRRCSRTRTCMPWGT